MRAPCRRRWRPRGRPPASATSYSSLRPAPPSTCSTTTSIAAKCSRTSSGSLPDDRDEWPRPRDEPPRDGGKSVGGSGGGAALAPPQIRLNRMPRRLTPDLWLFGIVLALVSIGVVMVYSASAIMAADRFHDP